MPQRLAWFVAVLCGMLVLSPSARAEPLPIASVPEPLRTWVPWALGDAGDTACVTLDGSDAITSCAWPARLSISVDDHGARFQQRWHVDAHRWVRLPGDEKRWPEDVLLDKKRAVVVARDGTPSVEMGPGDHLVEGAFAWDAPPESLQIPKDTGLFALTLRGASVPAEGRDESGVVWLSRAGQKEEGERLDVIVHRKLTDSVPFLLTTRIELAVAGQSREILLGRALPPGFVPLSLDAPIPARVEPDGRVRVQVRAGTFVLTLVARSEAPVTELARPDPGGPWREGEEIWVFEAKSEVRLVTIEGVSSIDPQQTSLPAEWKVLPAHPMQKGDRMRLVERRRGDADPPPDQLSLERTMWLDFAGDGYTMSDHVKGSLARDGRIEMTPPIVLGRVSVRQSDRFITHLGETRATGVELRRGPLDLTADSRVEGSPGDVPAVGWAHDFHRVSAVLHLPPGYRLFHASGVDDVPTTWLRHWSLLELFLALVTSIAVARLYGAAWGALALALFALLFPESEAPKWIWIVALAAEALARALPNGRVGTAIGLLRSGTLVVLVLITIPFLTHHLRQGLFPVLARPEVALGEVAPAAQREETEGDGQEGVTVAPSAPSAAAPLGRWSSGGPLSKGAERTYEREAVDPNAMVQTGPGLPRWTWTRVDLKWSGPVVQTQRLRLFLITPGVNRALAFVRAALLVLLVLRLLPWLARRGPPFWRRAPVLAALALLAITLPPRTADADIPDKAMLEELAKRIAKPAPECAPRCAASPRLHLEASGDALRVRLQVDAAARTAVPLPGSAAAWTDVSLDGKPAAALLRHEGALWIALEPGSHQIVLTATLRGRESLQLALRPKPHRVEATLDGWTLEGVHEDGLADDDLQLTRVRKAGAVAPGLVAGTLPPFVRIERTLRIGQSWQVETRVTRASPLGAAIVLEVPLLPRESVTTADLRVERGKVLVNLGPQVSELVWRSVLEQTSPLELVAAKEIAAVEIWRVDVSPIWHARFRGIPFVLEPSAGEARLSELRPWPGERLTIEVVRPDGVPGRTLTIDTSSLVVRPGARATDAELTLVVRSSRGGEHTVTLPEGAQLSAVTINGAKVPIRQDGARVTLPIVPGSQTIVVSLRASVGWSPLYRTPAIDLGAPSVNSSVTIEGCTSRWLLAMTGPPAGPVVLFWSLLLVVLVVAHSLSRSHWTPLGTVSWALLGLGLSQVSVVAAAIVVGWLFLLGFRRQRPTLAPAKLFNLRQVAIVVATFAALITLAVAVHQGLLGDPEMQVQGNASSASSLRWFADRSANTPAVATVLSVPVLVYRGAMLAWSLWIALAVLRWIRWGWEAFSSGGLWHARPPSPRLAPPGAGAPAPASSPEAPGNTPPTR